MKYLAALFLLIVGFIICSSQSNNRHSEVFNDFNDSINNIIEGRRFLYYTIGHHGHIWSVAVAGKDGYILISGNTRANDYHIDTLSINEPILKWGLDTMASYSKNMKTIENSSYSPFYKRLLLFSSQKEIIFDWERTNTYRGTDSLTFNEKFNKLKYFMLWTAFPPEFQEKLPTAK